MANDVSKLGGFNYNMAYADRLINDQPPVVVTQPQTQGSAAFCPRNPGFKGDTVELSTQQEEPKQGMGTGAKVGIGALAAAAIGGIIYFCTRKKGGAESAKAAGEAVEDAVKGLKDLNLKDLKAKLRELGFKAQDINAKVKEAGKKALSALRNMASSVLKNRAKAEEQSFLTREEIEKLDPKKLAKEVRSVHRITADKKGVATFEYMGRTHTVKVDEEGKIVSGTSKAVKGGAERQMKPEELESERVAARIQIKTLKQEKAEKAEAAKKVAEKAKADAEKAKAAEAKKAPKKTTKKAPAKKAKTVDKKASETVASTPRRKKAGKMTAKGKNK